MKFLALALFIGVAAAQLRQPISVLDCYAIQPTGWTYPFNTGAFNYRTIGLRDVFERPVLVVAPTYGTDAFTGYFVQHGLRSIKHLGGSYLRLNEFFRQPYEMTGVIFYPKGIYNDKLFNFGLHRVVFPDNFRASTFFRGMLDFGDVPVLMVLPKTYFNSLQLTGYSPLGRFGIYDDVIEPFYGSYIPQYPYFPQYPVYPRYPFIPQYPLIPQIPFIPQVPIIPQIPVIPQIPAVPQVPVITGSDSVAHSEAVSGAHSGAGSIAGSGAGSIAGSGAGSIAGSGAGSIAGSGAGSIAGSTAGSVAGSGAGSIAGSGAESFSNSGAASLAGSHAGSGATSFADSGASSLAGSGVGIVAGGVAGSSASSMAGSNAGVFSS